MLDNIKLANDLLLIRLSDTTTSGKFELEKKEYQRKNIGIIEKKANYKSSDLPFVLEVGDKVVFDENVSIDFEYEGTRYCTASIYDIQGVIR